MATKKPPSTKGRKLKWLLRGATLIGDATRHPLKPYGLARANRYEAPCNGGDTVIVYSVANDVLGPSSRIHSATTSLRALTTPESLGSVCTLRTRFDHRCCAYSTGCTIRHPLQIRQVKAGVPAVTRRCRALPSEPAVAVVRFPPRQCCRMQSEYRGT